MLVNWLQISLSYNFASRAWKQWNDRSPFRHGLSVIAASPLSTPYLAEQFAAFQGRYCCILVVFGENLWHMTSLWHSHVIFHCLIGSFMFNRQQTSTWAASRKEFRLGMTHQHKTVIYVYLHSLFSRNLKFSGLAQCQTYLNFSFVNEVHLMADVTSIDDDLLGQVENGLNACRHRS